jgi:hypothetical protein
MAHNNFLSPVWVNAGATVDWWYTFYDNPGVHYDL